MVKKDHNGAVAQCAQSVALQIIPILDFIQKYKIKFATFVSNNGVNMGEMALCGASVVLCVGGPLWDKSTDL